MKVIIIRFSSIGDIVLTSPIARCLHQQAAAEVHYLTKPAFRQILEHNPHIAKVHIWNGFTQEIKEELQKERYDYIVDLHKNIRSFRIRNMLGVTSFSFPKLNLEKWLVVNMKLNYLPKRHIVARYFEAVKSLGVINDGGGLDYFIPETSQAAAHSFFIKNKLSLNESDAFVLGAAHYTKQIPLEKWREILSTFQGKAILIGGKNEVALAQQLLAEFPTMLVNACAVFDINGSAALINLCKTIVTPDTGMMHIAAALDKHIFSIWGSTIPEFGMTPYPSHSGKNDFVILENKNLSCRPCSKIGYTKCPKGHFKCMRENDMSQITIK